MKAMFLAAAALAALTQVAAAQAAPPAPVAQLIAQADQLNDQCRGGSGDSPKTQAACDRRDAAMAQVEKAGWCWGPDDAIGADKRWVPCAPARSPWFAADRNSTSCFDLTFSPADWIRDLQETGVRPQVRDLVGGAVEVSATSGGLRSTRTFFRSKGACLAALPRAQAVSSRYE